MSSVSMFHTKVASMTVQRLSLSTLSIVWLSMFMTGCAVLHSVQLGEIDSQAVLQGRHFEIKVSDVGFSTEDAVAIAEAIAMEAGSSEGVSVIGDIIALFQMGPKTGNPVFHDDYSDTIGTWLAQECPSGNITGLMAIRESADYPVISGEIVRLVGYCFKD